MTGNTNGKTSLKQLLEIFGKRKGISIAGFSINIKIMSSLKEAAIAHGIFCHLLDQE
jgi:hypothetical protein